MDRSPLADRVNDLEMLLTHQQRDLAELNAALVTQQRQIDELQRKVAQLARAPQADPATEGGDPLIYDAPPPHW